MKLATVRLAADSLDPTAVTRALDLHPDTAARKGERMYPRSKSRAVAPTGIWFRSVDMGDVRPFAEFARVVTLLEGGLPTLKSEVPDLRVSFTIFSQGEKFSQSDLPADLGAKINALGPLEIESVA